MLLHQEGDFTMIINGSGGTVFNDRMDYCLIVYFGCLSNLLTILM